MNTDSRSDSLHRSGSSARSAALPFAASLAAALALAPAVGAQSPTSLVVLPAAFRALEVSGDGTVVVGSSGIGGAMWTAAGGLVLLGTVPGDQGANATDVNGDGTRIVGTSWNNFFSFSQAMNASASPPASLGFLPGHTHSSADDVSTSGVTVVGSSSSNVALQQAVRWDLGVIGALPSLDPQGRGRAAAVDADGSAIAGTGDVIMPVIGYVEHAVLWQGNLPVDLGTVAGRTHSEALAISDDGLVVAGNSWNAGPSGGRGNEVAYRWSWSPSGGAMQDLGMPHSVVGVRLGCLSRDGTVAGGIAFRGPGQSNVAALWKAGRGWIHLPTLLLHCGVPLGGIELEEVLSVSANGSTVLCRTPTGSHVLIRDLPLGGFTTRSTGCGDLELFHSGLPRPGHTIQVGIWNGSGSSFRGLVGGVAANTILPQCPSCTVGVSGATLPEGILLAIPNSPTLVGVQFSLQGFDFATGPCLGVLRLTDTIDVTIQ